MNKNNLEIFLQKRMSRRDLGKAALGVGGTYLLDKYAGPILDLGTFSKPKEAKAAEDNPQVIQAIFNNLWGKIDGDRLWGPEYSPLSKRPYKEAPGGEEWELVYQKGIMEYKGWDTNDPKWIVTSARIPDLLIEGKVQVGKDSFIQKGTPETPIAGDDQNNPNSPTYKTLKDGGFKYKSPLGENQAIIQTLSRSGEVGQDQNYLQYGVKAGTFIKETNHRIADVFDQFRNAYSTLPYGDSNWLTGFPITEAYWTTINLGGKPTDVLVQVFERRTLTYTPSNPAGWQVELGNIGRDYERFRDTGGASEIVNNDGDGWHWKYTKNFMGKSAPVGLEPIDKAALDQVGPIMRQYGYSGDVEVDIITGPEERPDLDPNYWNTMRAKDPSGNETVIGSFWGNPGYRGPAIIYLDMNQLQIINNWDKIKGNLIAQAVILKIGIDDAQRDLMNKILPILYYNSTLKIN